MRLFKGTLFTSAAPEHDADELLSTLRLIVGLDQLIDYFTAGIRDLARTRSATVLLAEPITGRYTCHRHNGERSHFLFTVSDRLVGWLATNQSPLDLKADHDVVEFLSGPERLYLSQTGTRLVLPLVAMNRLTGILLLGAKEDLSSYSRTEVERLSRIAGQAALSIENASMYQLQEERLNKLFHADRLSTVGELAAGAAHEIRNPLTAIRSTIQFLRDSVPEDRRPMMDVVISESDRIDQIIKGMLSLSRSSRLELAPTNLPDVVNSVFLLLESKLRRQGIKTLRSAPVDNLTIMADRTQLQQALLNICLNSIEAMPEGGTLTAAMTSSHNGRCNACLSISDTGAGIPETDLSRVFDPFFTTKEIGTGLGLSICYGIVANHGGDIQIHSSTEGPQRGTTVTLKIPCQDFPSEPNV